MGKNELITMKKFISIDMQATGKQIKKIMLQQGYTINDIKEYLYLKNPPAIYKWFRGESIPKIDVLFALSKLFNVPIDDLIIGESLIIDNQNETNKGTNANE